MDEKVLARQLEEAGRGPSKLTLGLAAAALAGVARVTRARAAGAATGR